MKILEENILFNIFGKKKLYEQSSKGTRTGPKNQQMG